MLVLVPLLMLTWLLVLLLMLTWQLVLLLRTRWRVASRCIAESIMAILCDATCTVRSAEKRVVHQHAAATISV